ncbi:hypothetical protein [Geothrix fuzhouensis]|uniref:hypothetical protein n=1 Tax=Geothrix fuzhouensis TaxID=2966451 RepID=UPI00214938E2|nr:hypothetical protein [Geothrix fuzhouensis]
MLDDRGLGEASYFLFGLGGGKSKVRRLKGWNLRPDGDLTQLDTDAVVTLDGDLSGEITTAVATGFRLPRAMKGSILAFESLESLRHPMGPTAVAGIMQRHPVRRWELEAAASGGWFTDLKNVSIQLDVRHAEPWLKNPQVVPGRFVKADAIPAIPKDEGASSHPRNTFPSVTIRFLDPDFREGPSTENWDKLAEWVDQQYQPRFQPSKPMDTRGMEIREALKTISRWMAKELTYKQVYLSPDRGWFPDPGPEVVRHRYGDCKDLTCCLLSEAKGLDLEVHPVLALIGHGLIEEDEVPSPNVFDHAIGAIKLEKSLGFPAEIGTPQGRFLLVDPTSRLTPLGLLPAYLRDQRVMICTSRGAVWVRIPTSAVEVPAGWISLEGEVDTARKCTAKLRVVETGDLFGLRNGMLKEGDKGIQQRLAAVLDLSPAATLEIDRIGDPLDLSQPFTVTAKVVQPGALRPEANGETLVAWGLPPVPQIIQKVGVARRLPVLVRLQGRLELQATYHLPWVVEPLLPRLTIDSPFRTLNWTAKVQREGPASRVTLRCTQELRPAFFDDKAREQGLAEWKRDRAQVLRLHRDGVALSHAD